MPYISNNLVSCFNLELLKLLPFQYDFGKFSAFQTRGLEHCRPKHLNHCWVTKGFLSPHCVCKLIGQTNRFLSLLRIQKSESSRFQSPPLWNLPTCLHFALSLLSPTPHSLVSYVPQCHGQLSDHSRVPQSTSSLWRDGPFRSTVVCWRVCSTWY